MNAERLKIREIGKAIEAWAPAALAESYDNVGLLVGDPDREVTGVLINLDVTEALIDEAVEKDCNLILTHHPIWFMPRKRLNGEDYVSRIIIKAIRADVALYACHTNLDNVHTGVNEMIGRRLGVRDMRILRPKKDLLRKLVAFVVTPESRGLSDALYAAGARQVRLGAEGRETRLETVFAEQQKGSVLNIVQRYHRGEALDWHVVPADGALAEIGSGMIGELVKPLGKADFLKHVSEAFGCGGIRYADGPQKEIKKVAWCGGAGSFLTGTALRAGADAFVTGDITYHKFFDNEGKMLLLDIGHYESEQFTSELIYNYLSKNFANFAVRLSELKTNPVKYF